MKDREQLLSLLQQGFENRTEDHFEWKYDLFPDFNENHIFTASKNNELAAVRRLVYKELVGNGSSNVPLFVGADFVVDPNYRDEGLYERLLMQTNRYERSQNTELSMSFSRKGYVTFETKRWFDWEYQPLPLYIHVLSPEKAVPHYATIALEDTPIPESVVYHQVSSTLMNLSGRALPSSITAIGVEAVSAETPPTSWTRHLRRRGNREKNIVSAADSIDKSSIDSIVELYQQVLQEYDYHFRRDRRDIEHMLSHPYLTTTILAEEQGDIVGFAPLIAQSAGEVTEARVLDIVATDNEIFEALLSKVEMTAREQKVDLISMITHHDPGSQWAQVDKQMQMWDWRGKKEQNPVSDTELGISFYDVV